MCASNSEEIWLLGCSHIINYNVIMMGEAKSVAYSNGPSSLLVGSSPWLGSLCCVLRQEALHFNLTRDHSTFLH